MKPEEHNIGRGEYNGRDHQEWIGIMNMEPTPISVESKSVGQVSTPSLTLSACVRMAVEQYFQQINGHTTSDLYEFVLAEVEKPLIQTVLEQVGQNQTKAAAILGLSRATLRKMVRRYGLE